MDTSITEYLNTLDFPKLIEEKSTEDCFKNFCQDYNLLLQSLELPLSPLSEKSENNRLLTALLQTLAERESLLRREINQLLQILIPAPGNGKKRGAENQQLDEIIALFGMRREFSLEEESENKIYETDEHLKRRITSRLGILSKTGTKTAYIHTLLSLNTGIKDIAIIRQTNEAEKLSIYFLPTIEELLKKGKEVLKKVNESLQKVNLDDLKTIKADLQKVNLDDLKKIKKDMQDINDNLQKIKADLQKVNLDDLTKVSKNLQKIKADLQKVNLDDLTKVSKNLQKIKADLQKVNLDDLKKIKKDMQDINENLQKVNLDDLTKVSENLKKIKADLQKINLDDLKKDSENLKKIKADLQKINENLQKVNLDDLTKINENLQKVNEDLQKIKENPNLLFEQASIQWLASIKPDLEKKIEQQDLIPIRDKHILSNGKIRSVAVQITLKDKETLDMADENSILKICESYFNKKYTFNAVISRSELLSYFDYHLIKKNENLEIVLKEKNENGEEIKPISLLACKAYEAPLFWKLTINTKEYKKLIKPNEPT